MYYIAKPVTLELKIGGSSKSQHTVALPAGLRCSPIDGEPDTFFLDEFPESIFPKNSIFRHDAEHYGFRLSGEEVLTTKNSGNLHWFELKSGTYYIISTRYNFLAVKDDKVYVINWSSFDAQSCADYCRRQINLQNRKDTKQ